MNTPADAPLLVVVGPTASGKTNLAIRLAELGGGEVVSADSVQVYRHFDIGSAKPTAAERARAPHHLIGVVEPAESLEAAQWAQRAENLLDVLHTRGARPILCGGTFLWVRALLHGLVEAPPGDPALRAEHLAITDLLGREELHDRLARVDPDSAARLHPNDFVRVSRALEVFQLSGRRLSALQAAHGFRTQRHRAHLIAILNTPEDHDRRVRERCRLMFEEGWITEVEGLLEAGYADTRPMGAVGYRQISRALLGGSPLDNSARQRLEDEVVRATRVFARRQRTWLRDQPVRWLTPAQADNPAFLRALLEEA